MQLYWVMHHGTFLANRWEDDGGINDTTAPATGAVPLSGWAWVMVGAMVLHSFNDSEALQD